jgi:hypothetical protein
LSGNGGVIPLERIRTWADRGVARKVAVKMPCGRQTLPSALRRYAYALAERIRCPTLICGAEGDLFFKGQPQQLYDHLTCKKTLLSFTNDEGAGAHCEVGASRFAFARIYDWLDETLGV